MRYLCVCCVILATATTNFAYDLGLQAPDKAVPVIVPNVPVGRVGGDTIATAVLIPGLPFNDTGNTTGYADDYDEACPYTGSTAPDVVYSFVSASPQIAAFDLYGSSYDTKVFVYDANGALVACNDDYYSDYTSFVVACLGVGTYYIVIDGYYGDYGVYTFAAYNSSCVIDCPAGGVAEGEPPLNDEYVDNWNGGCNTSPGYPFQNIACGGPWGEYILCGVAGWYLFQGANHRDTDWFHLYMGDTGNIEITGDAEQATYIFELGPQDCASVGVLQLATIGPCTEGYMTISGYAPGAPVWFWVGSNSFTQVGCDNEYDYVIWFQWWWIATEPQTWGGVKALFE